MSDEDKEAPASEAARAVKKIQFWAGLAAAVAAAGFSTALFLGRYAETSDVEKLTTRIEAKAAAEEVRVTALEVALARIEEDFHFVADQVQEIARTTRSRVLAAPHRGER